MTKRIFITPTSYGLISLFFFIRSASYILIFLSSLFVHSCSLLCFLACFCFLFSSSVFFISLFPLSSSFVLCLFIFFYFKSILCFVILFFSFLHFFLTCLICLSNFFPAVVDNITRTKICWLPVGKHRHRCKSWSSGPWRLVVTK
jgi:hypothetical protein